MGTRFKSLTGALAIFTTVCVGSAATAQPAPNNQSPQNGTLSDRFEQVFFANDRDFSANRSFLRQLDFIIGIGSPNTGFVENEINADTKAITALYKDALLQQGSSDPIVRTRDLPNPYDTSILQYPLIEAIKGSEPTPQGL